MRTTSIILLIIIALTAVSCGVGEAKADENVGIEKGLHPGQRWGLFQNRRKNQDFEQSAGEDVHYTIDWDGLEREYWVHVPPGYDAASPTPLVMNFHGGGSNAREQTNVSHMLLKSDAEGFIAVHPEATGERGHRWNGGPHADREDVDDVGFIGAMLDKVEADYNIDPDRVYATGISSGGFMSYRLACEMAERIAAIAPVAAMLDFECEASSPVAVMHFHGTDDKLCPYNGGEGYLLHYPFRPVEEAINYWIQQNSCSEEYEITFEKDDVTCYTYKSSIGADVAMCRIDGGGHNWPGGAGAGRDLWYLGHCTDTISATDMMWEFFEQHPKVR